MCVQIFLWWADLQGGIGFMLEPTLVTLGNPLQADCVVAAPAGLQNPSADITWLGPDGSIFGSQQSVPFSEVTVNGNVQQEARLPLRFTSFGPADVGEYSCLASITSDSFPGEQTNLFRSFQIPTTGSYIHHPSTGSYIHHPSTDTTPLYTPPQYR